MNRFAVGFMALCVALGATQTMAATTAIRYASITGSLSGQTTGACPVSKSYADQCPVGPCNCVQIPNATVGAAAGQSAKIAGTGTADVFLTLDTGAATVSGADSCTPFFGVAELTTKRAGTTLIEHINMNGVECSPITGSNEEILGGFGIAAKPAPTNGAKGYGKITGSVTPGGTVSLTLKGSITE